MQRRPRGRWGGPRPPAPRQLEQAWGEEPQEAWRRSVVAVRIIDGEEQRLALGQVGDDPVERVERGQTAGRCAAGRSWRSGVRGQVTADDAGGWPGHARAGPRGRRRWPPAWRARAAAARRRSRTRARARSRGRRAPASPCARRGRGAAASNAATTVPPAPSTSTRRPWPRAASFSAAISATSSPWRSSRGCSTRAPTRAGSQRCLGVGLRVDPGRRPGVRGDHGRHGHQRQAAGPPQRRALPQRGRRALRAPPGRDQHGRPFTGWLGLRRSSRRRASPATPPRPRPSSSLLDLHPAFLLVAAALVICAFAVQLARARRAPAPIARASLPERQACRACNCSTTRRS